jgi:hypothetical protein
MGWHKIVYEDSRCVILSNSMGFSFVELYSGIPMEGLVVFGPIATYGIYHFHDQKGNEIFYGYLDDWGMSKSKAIETINRKCRPR